MASSPSYIIFPPFHLEMTTARLWHGEQLLRLRPQAVAVLRCLLERPHQLVSKAELFATLWPSVIISSSVLKTYIWEIRRALDDQQQRPRFIETIPRRGYRFIGKVVSDQFSVVSKNKRESSDPQLATGNWQVIPGLVGRAPELARLHSWLDKAFNEERQIVFVTGEAGTGKTVLINAFLEQVQEARDWRLETSPLAPQASSLSIGRGQCLEHRLEHHGTKPICQYWKPWDGSVGRLGVSKQSLYCVSTHPPGYSSSPRC
jgi:DNA-binding winged helix-turn-helix (wHTH) protein